MGSPSTKSGDTPRVQPQPLSATYLSVDQLSAPRSNLSPGLASLQSGFSELARLSRSDSIGSYHSGDSVPWENFAYCVKSNIISMMVNHGQLKRLTDIILPQMYWNTGIRDHSWSISKWSEFWGGLNSRTLALVYNFGYVMKSLGYLGIIWVFLGLISAISFRSMSNGTLVLRPFQTLEHLLDRQKFHISVSLLRD